MPSGQPSYSCFNLIFPVMKKRGDIASFFQKHAAKKVVSNPCADETLMEEHTQDQSIIVSLFYAYFRLLIWCLNYLYGNLCTLHTYHITMKTYNYLLNW